MESELASWGRLGLAERTLLVTTVLARPPILVSAALACLVGGFAIAQRRRCTQASCALVYAAGAIFLAALTAWLVAFSAVMTDLIKQFPPPVDFEPWMVLPPAAALLLVLLAARIVSSDVVIPDGDRTTSLLAALSQLVILVTILVGEASRRACTDLGKDYLRVLDLVLGVWPATGVALVGSAAIWLLPVLLGVRGARYGGWLVLAFSCATLLVAQARLQMVARFLDMS
ncbi:MAG: hypothetical protein HYZ53_14325 [Planctomycetes bacterium]|nr:hypothetical protein [Planctomycetota bacterium]